LGGGIKTDAFGVEFTAERAASRISNGVERISRAREAREATRGERG